MAEYQTRKPIPGYEGIYEIDIYGNVYSLKRMVRGGKQEVKERTLKPIRHKWHGYTVISLAKDGKATQYRLHRLVASVFIPNPEGKPTVNHISADKSDNRVCNLEWATSQEQSDHASMMGLTMSGEKNYFNRVPDRVYIDAIRRVLDGELIQDVARDIGVNRNAIRPAAYRLGYGAEWRSMAASRKRDAANMRHHGRRDV